MFRFANATESGDSMRTPDDLKDYSSDDDDAFQIMRPRVAAQWLAVLVLFVWLIETAPK